MTTVESFPWLNLGYALALFSVGYVVAKKVSMVLQKTLAKRFSAHQALIIDRIFFYTLFSIFFISGLQYLGFKLNVLLGAAGILTVALSFASQTVASNLISGVFLLFERAFKVGDQIEVKSISGTITSIDLLSTKIRTVDNKLVRIANESMIKAEITNLSFFPTRRLDIILTVAENHDILTVRTLLLKSAAALKEVLQDPAAKVSLNTINNGALEFKLMVWVNTNVFAATQCALQEQIKQHFDEAGIKAPTPQLIVQTINPS